MADYLVGGKGLANAGLFYTTTTLTIYIFQVKLILFLLELYEL